MRYTLQLLLLILLSTSVVGQDKFPLVTDYYKLDLAFDFEKEIIYGSSEITIRNNSDETVNQIPLLLYRLMKIESVQTLSNQKLPFSQNVTQFEDFKKLQTNYIVIDEEILPNESKTIKLNYSGYLLGYQETGMNYVKDKISPEFTIIRNDAYSYPIIAKPSIAFLRKNIASNYFEYKIKVTVPDSLVVANGGYLDSLTSKNNKSIYQFTSKKPNWRIDIAIAPYKKLQTNGMNIYYFKEDSLAAYNLSEYGLRAFNYYKKWWGELKNRNSITIIETGEKSGGQADETTILLPKEAFTNQDNYDYLYHELSHLWNVKIEEKEGVSPRWEEGLSTFCQYLITEKLNQGKDGLVKDRANKNIKRLKNSFEKNPKLLSTPMAEFGNEQLTNYSYRQGLIMFSVLYYWLGEDKFNQAIGGFYQKYYKTGASTKDFTDYWEKLFPDKHLNTFFNDWMYDTKYTNYILSDNSIDFIINHYELK